MWRINCMTAAEEFIRETEMPYAQISASQARVTKELSSSSCF